MNRLFFFIGLLLISSCDSYEIPPIDEAALTSDLFEGMYLSDNVFFPNDTLILKPFSLADTSTREKLMLHFKNDSVYLSNYNFDGWYGKWFCDFHEANAIFSAGSLSLHAQFRRIRKLRCQNENTNDIWADIEYQLIDSSEQSITYVLSLDTTNCITSVIRVFHNSSRGGRNFTSEGGEQIRTDIQLR
jgi:hypothetical protein